MTIATYSTLIAHNSDAAFRAWGGALSNALQSCGLTKTADTGQIDWNTVMRPGVNGVGGYEIYAFNDALQATAPVFIKIEYGTGGNASYPQIWITVGTGSDGAGTLTGLVSTRTATGSSYVSSVLASTVTAYPTYVCYKDGFLGFLFKVGAAYNANPSAVSFVAIGRSVDDTGAETGEGVYFLSKTSGNASANPQGIQCSPALQYLRFTDNKVSTRSVNFALIPGDVASSLSGTDFQAFKCYVMTPRMRPLHSVACVLASEYAAGTVFDATLVGSTARAYLSCGEGMNYCTATQSALYSMAMLWE